MLIDIVALFFLLFAGCRDSGLFSGATLGSTLTLSAGFRSCSLWEHTYLMVKYPLGCSGAV
jgi:hypothetical protein